MLQEEIPVDCFCLSLPVSEDKHRQDSVSDYISKYRYELPLGLEIISNNLILRELTGP
jgi:hypothetical protein